MGVQGLWQVVGPTGRPISFQSLKGKVLAVDVSIWLHQVVKGFRDKDGNPLPNAHLLGVFYRLCKLLHYGIKPVFVFDGGVPILKRQTMMQRRKRKLEALDKAEVSRRKILSNFLQQQLQRNVRQVVPASEADLEGLEESEDGTGTRSPPKKKARSVSPKKRFGGGPSSSKGIEEDKDTFHEALEAFREKFKAEERVNVSKILEETSDSDDDEESSRGYYGMDYSENFSAIVSNDFDALPLETQHEILFQMQESRKMNSWGKVDEMPTDLKDFSSFQMDRLVKRRFLQKKIQTVQQEMGQRHIHVQNLDDLLKMEYDLEDKSQEIIGSQEKGCVLVRKKTGTTRQDSTQKTKSEAENSKVEENITLDDNWSETSESEDECIEEIKTAKSSSEEDVNWEMTKDSMIMKRASQLTEEEELSLAIERSLEESKVAVSAASTDQVCKTAVTSNADHSAHNSKSQQSNTKPIQSINEELTPNVVKPIIPVLSNVSHSQLASCSKFLDTIGFSAKVSSSQSQTQPFNSSDSEGFGLDKLITKKATGNLQLVEEERDSTSSDSDFEAVEEGDESPNEDARVPGINLQSTNVAAVILFDEVTKAPLDNDIFADIFSEQERPNPEAKSPKNASESVPTEAKNIQDSEWDSDPDITALDNDDEMQNNSVKSSTESPRNKIEERQNPTTDEAAVKSIARTLGKRPDQSNTEARAVKFITAEYMQAQEKLNTEQDKLQSQRGFQERVATSITDQMNIETQELISLFGIPYIVSPMEAESQCAFLDAACLTEGTITDDSDVWLFGGQRVYKNFYAQGDRHLEFYQLADMIKVLGLDRDKLVLIAMISGGDYSEGIEGCGPVSALELLAEFPTNSIEAYDVLVQFREWWDMAQLQQTPLESKIREKLRKLKLKPGFPNKAVYDAYMNPTIDTSTDPFRWGTPDLDAIRTYTKNKFGWNQTKCDGMLLPVIKNLRCQADQAKQQTLDKFVVHGLKPSLGNGIKQKTGSKRLNVALQKLRKAFPGSGNLQLSSSSESDSSSDQEDDEDFIETPIEDSNNSVTFDTSSSVESSPKVLPCSSSQSQCVENPNTSTLGTISNNRKSALSFRKTEVSIPQKVQAETIRKRNKHKAIEIFKSKKS